MAMSNEARRRASGAAMEASRRAGGAAMEERRRGKQLVDDINSLANPPANRKTLRTVDPVGGVPARRGSGVYQAPATGGTGGGIASPLVEKTKTVEGEQVPDRSYYESVLLPTTDGLVWARWRSVKTIRMTDANGESVVMEYGNDLSE